MKPQKTYYIEQGKKNIYSLWENQLSDGDSTTPSVSCVNYRTKMVSLISELIDTAENSPIISIGCGNAFVEAELVAKKIRVIGLDLHQEAIHYAREKGVDARCQDLNLWNPAEGEFKLAYCDGILGHLYENDLGLQPILLKLAHCLSAGGHIVVSNDPSENGESIQAHPNVPGFNWFSTKFLESELVKAGFDDIISHNFEYVRPISGMRTRLVLSARKRIQ